MVNDQILLGEVDGRRVRDLLSETEAPGAELFVEHLSRPRTSGRERALDEVRLLAPIARPGKILCIGP